MVASLKILIVDDVDAVRLSLSSAFRVRGYDTVLASDGAEGMALAQKTMFDFLITDIWMPGMNGLQLLKCLKDANPALRVVAITGGGPKLTLEAASSLAEVWGAERVFIKPFDEMELIDFIEGKA
jgi:two-component system, chemotaxis family, chemotaxis protein CheY